MLSPPLQPPHAGGYRACRGAAVVEGPEVDLLSEEVVAISDAFASFTSYEPEQLFDLADVGDVIAPGVFIDSAVSDTDDAFVFGLRLFTQF